MFTVMIGTAQLIVTPTPEANKVTFQQRGSGETINTSTINGTLVAFSIIPEPIMEAVIYSIVTQDGDHALVDIKMVDNNKDNLHEKRWLVDREGIDLTTKAVTVNADHTEGCFYLTVWDGATVLHRFLLTL